MKNNITVKYIDELVREYIPKNHDKVSLAIEYSLFSGGKRFRPMLLLQTAKAVGKRLTDNAKRLACALEYIHTYSLIHDDLPSMDNDDLRRGKRSCHTQYGEAAAILAGDALLNLAAETLFMGNFNSKNYREACAYMFLMSGSTGMIHGQNLDLFTATKSIDDANQVALHKTGDLIRAAIVCGALVGGATAEEKKIFDQIAINLGIAYQVVDDLLDADKCERSFLDIMTADGCRNYVVRLNDEVMALCDKLPYDLQFIRDFSLILFQTLAFFCKLLYNN